MENLFIAFCTSAAMLGTLGGAIGIKNIAKHGVKVDIGLTLICYWIFAGTSTDGIIIAVISGLIICIFTRSIKAYWKWAANLGYLSSLEESSVDWTKSKEQANKAKSKLFDILAEVTS